MHVDLERIRDRLVETEEKKYEKKAEAMRANYLSYVAGITDALDAVEKEMKNHE